MFSRVREFLFPSEENRTTTRNVVEILLYYVVLAAIFLAQPKFPAWVLIPLTAPLVLLLFESGREFLRVLLLAGVLVFGILRPFVVEPFYIPSRSMENTLLVNDHIFVSKLSYLWNQPERWDVVVFEYPKKPELDYIKRLVGKPGDRVEMREHQLYVNGESISQRLDHREVELTLDQAPSHVSSTESPQVRTYRFKADGFRLNQEYKLGANSTRPVRGFVGLTKIYLEARNHFVKVSGEQRRNGTREVAEDFGPVRVPEVGDEVDLTELSSTERNYYENLMRVWFDREVRRRNGRIHVGTEPRDTLRIREPLYFVLGDNRDHSEDSRVWGFVPAQNLQGEALFIYYPFHRLGLIGGV